MWKIKHNLVPNDVNLEFSTSNRKSANEAVVKPMPKTTGKLLTLFENSFIIKAPKLWNKLPSKIRVIDNLKMFINELDKFLCKIPDQPPVTGYYHTNKNPILEYNTSQF